MIVSGIWAKKEIKEELLPVYLVAGRELLQQKTALNRIEKVLKTHNYQIQNYFINSESELCTLLDNSHNQLDIFANKVARKIFINLPFEKFLGTDFACDKVYANRINVFITNEDLGVKTLSHKKIVAINNIGVIVKTEVLSKDIHKNLLVSKSNKLGIKLSDGIIEKIIDNTYANSKASLEYLQLLASNPQHDNFYCHDLSSYTFLDLEQAIKKQDDKNVYKIYQNLSKNGATQLDFFNLVYRIIRFNFLDKINLKDKLGFFKKMDFIDARIKNNQNSEDFILEVLLFLTNNTKYKFFLLH